MANPERLKERDLCLLLSWDYHHTKRLFQRKKGWFKLFKSSEPQSCWIYYFGYQQQYNYTKQPSWIEMNTIIDITPCETNFIDLSDLVLKLKSLT